jgi:cystathionine beta-lyase/cystathionine gamma-synthase
MKFETLAIHAGQEPDPNNGAVMTPVYLTSTYKQDGIGKPRQGYEYSRTLNPTRKALQDCLAELESGQWGLAFASGMAATDTVLRMLGSGDHVVAGNDVYGGTFRLFDKVLRRFGLDFTFADTTDPENLAEALTPSTRIVWLETPTNPLLAVTDIRAVAEIVQESPEQTFTGRGQYLRHTLFTTSAGTGRGSGRPLDDKISRRTFGCGRRRDHWQR